LAWTNVKHLTSDM